MSDAFLVWMHDGGGLALAVYAFILLWTVAIVGLRFAPIWHRRWRALWRRRRPA